MKLKRMPFPQTVNGASSVPTMKCIFLEMSTMPSHLQGSSCPRTFQEAVEGLVRDRCSPEIGTIKNNQPALSLLFSTGPFHFFREQFLLFPVLACSTMIHWHPLPFHRISMLAVD
uniref:Uncharacterized protein n=1 Tax=Salix viminalis TaxID=40686 RepID=A0A6N2KM92_SALVM